MSEAAEQEYASLAAIAQADPGGDAKGAAERAYDAIRSAIVRGALTPGTALGEDELAAALGISRTPVRSALQTLLAEHLVESGPRRQIFVRGVAPRSAARSCSCARRSNGWRSERRARG